jgi:hypothetical protein
MTSDAQDTRTLLWVLFGSGLIAGVVSGLIWAAATPDPTDEYVGARVFAVVLAAASGLMTSLAVIAWGVVLGIRAHGPVPVSLPASIATAASPPTGQTARADGPASRRKKTLSEISPLDRVTDVD